MNTLDEYDPFTDGDSGYSNVAFFADGGETSLEDQIRARWGAYGDWKSADQDQVAALANLMRQNGVQDLSQFKIASRDWTTPAYQMELDAGYQQVPENKGTAYDVSYGGEQLGFLGDVNDDGSLTRYDKKLDPQGGHLGYLRDGNLLGWSAQGGGHTNFQVMQGPDGEPVVVPVWASSSQDDIALARNTALLAAIAAGGAYAAGASGTTAGATAGATAGTVAGTAAGSTTLGLTSAQWSAIASAAGKGAMTSAATNALMQLRANGWDLGELNGELVIKSAATGAVAGSVSGIVGAYNPGGALTTNATGASVINNTIAGGATAALTGRDMDEVWKSALASGINGASDYAAAKMGVDPKLLRMVLPLAQGNTDRAIRMLAQYGYDAAKPEVAGYLRDLTNMDPTPLTQTGGSDGDSDAELYDNAGIYGESGYTADNGDGGSQEPEDTELPDNSDPSDDPTIDPVEGDEDRDGWDMESTVIPEVTPPTDTGRVDTDLPPVEPEPPPVTPIPIPDVVITPTTGGGGGGGNKPTTPVATATDNSMGNLMMLMQMLQKNEDRDSGYTAPSIATRTNETPYGEIGGEGGVYGS